MKQRQISLPFCNCMYQPTCAKKSTSFLYTTQSIIKCLVFNPLRLTQNFQLFANESLRFAALALFRWPLDGLGPLLAAALINPNLWAASASARLNVAISSAWAMGGFTVAPQSISVVILKFGRWCEARRFSVREWRVWQYPPFAPPGQNEEPGLMLVGSIFWLAAWRGRCL